MNHNKDDVLPKAAPIWVDILLSLTSLDASIFNPKKEHPCPICGGTTRFRYRDQPVGLEAPFFCNNCGSRNGITMLMECTGLDFSEAINTVGDHLGCMPVERLEIIKREFEVKSSFPKWYKFDIKLYDHIKANAEMKINSWQRINGLQMVDMHSYENKAVIPLINKHDKEVDFALIDIDGNEMSSAGNSTLPTGVFSEFGSYIGGRTYLTVKPLVAAKSHVFTGKHVVCTWEEENLFHVGIKYDFNVVVIVSNLSEVENADSLNLNQMIFDPKTNKVKNKIYLPYEIVAMRNA